MDVRLVQLLGSFIGARSAYVLARLECASAASEIPPAPLIDRLDDASEATLQQQWPHVERQLESALAYAKQAARSRSMDRQADAFRNLERTLRELDQYARAIRWVLTVTEREDAT